MSTRSLKASFIFDMRGNIARKARAAGESFKRLGRNGDQQFRRIERAAAAADRRLNKGLLRGAQVAGAAVGVAAVAAGRKIFTLEERLERLGVAAGKSKAEMMAVRDEVNAVANQKNIRIGPGEMLSGIEAFTEATGEFDLADQMKEQMALAIKATGAGGEAIGKLMASIFQKFDIKTPDAMLAALDTLTVQGKAGAVELRNLAVLGPKVYSAFARVGQGGMEGLAEASGLMQKFKEGVGSPQEAATVFENVINNLYNPTKMKKLHRAGVEMEGADGALKGPADLIKSVIASAGGNDLNLAKVFDAEAMRGFSILSKEFRDTGGFSSLDKLAGIRGDGSTINADSARLAELANSEIQSLANNVNDRIEDNLMEPMTELAKSLNALLDKGIKFTAEDALNVAAGGAAVVGLAKAGLWTMGMGAGRLSGRGRGKTGGAGAGTGLLDVQPVFVTNMPRGGMMGDGPGGRRKGATGTGKGRVLGKNGLPIKKTGTPTAKTPQTGGGTRASGGRSGLLRGASKLMPLASRALGPVAAAGTALYGLKQHWDFYGKAAAIESTAPWAKDTGPKPTGSAAWGARNTPFVPARGRPGANDSRTNAEIAMARRQRFVSRMTEAPPVMSSQRETTAELAAKLEAFLDAQEDTRAETQASGDKVVRAVNGLGDKLQQPVKPMPLSGVLMSQ